VWARSFDTDIALRTARQNNRQDSYLRNQPLFYNKENLIVEHQGKQFLLQKNLILYNKESRIVETRTALTTIQFSEIPKKSITRGLPCSSPTFYPHQKRKRPRRLS
jgi:hypothetical protein